MKITDAYVKQKCDEIENSIRRGVEKCFKSGEVTFEIKGHPLREFDDDGNPIIELLISNFTERILMLVYKYGIDGVRQAHFDGEDIFMQ